MSSSAAASVIKAAFVSAWDAELAAVREDNTSFAPSEAQSWVQLRFPGSKIARGDIGEPDAPLVDEVGSFMVDIFVPRGIGDDLARALADAVWDIFKFRNIDGVRCDERLTGQSGERMPDGVPGVWWGFSFGITYRYLSV